MSAEIAIKPDRYIWAIQRAGHELDTFVGQFPRVHDWINGDRKPTLKQLEEFCRKVHLPFGYLFLPEPPKEALPIPFFRSENVEAAGVSLNIYDTVLLTQRRMEWLSDYLKESGVEPLPFVGQYKLGSDVNKIVEAIRNVLHLNADWAHDCRDHEDALNSLTQRAEEAGIMVSFNSVVGNNNYRDIPVSDCRGFVLIDSHAPFMFINAADAKPAQLFTLVHELAHVWLGQSAGFDNEKLLPANDPVEKLCDQVAAEFLVPAQFFRQVWAEQPVIKYLSGYFKVSQIVIARRAMDLGFMSRNAFFAFYRQQMQEFQQRKNAKPSGGDFYATQKKRISLRFASYVNQAVKSNDLLYRDAYTITGLKGNTYQQFMNSYF